MRNSRLLYRMFSSLLRLFSFRQFGQFAFRVSQNLSVARHIFVDFFFQVVDTPVPNKVVAFVVFNADVTE